MNTVSKLDEFGRGIHIDPMNKKPVAPPKKKAALGSSIATVAMFAIVIFLWRDQSRMKAAQAELAEQNAALRDDLAAKKSELATAHTELDFFTTGEFGNSAQETKTKPVIATPIEEPETLLLQEPAVSQNAAGLVAHFEFKPDDGTVLPEQITLVVRIPIDSAVKILSLKPAGETDYSNVEIIVDAKGKLGMIEGSSADLKTLSFDLTVSAPVKAIVRGSKGIKAFELDIAPTGCTVRKL